MLLVFYVVHFLNRPELISTYFLVGGVAGLFSAPLAPFMLKYMSAQKLTMLSMGISGAISVLAFFIAPQNTVALFVLFAIIGLFRSYPFVTVTAMLVDTADHLHKITGKRSDGVLFSFNSFAIKLGSAIATGIVSIILTTTRYDASAYAQLESVVTGMNVGRNLVVAGIYVIAILLLTQFSIPKDDTN